MMRWLLVVFLFFVGHAVQANNPVEVDSIAFKRLRKKLKYDQVKTVWTPKKFDFDKPDLGKRNLSWVKYIGVVIKILGYVLLVLLFVGIIYLSIKHLEKIEGGKSPRKIDLDKIEDIEAVDLNALLEEALAQKDYRLALRIQFLRILQALTTSNQILWKPHKTNRTYVSEIANRETKFSFKKLADIFEYVWYGVIDIDRSTYEEMCVDFESFLNNIENEAE